MVEEKYDEEDILDEDELQSPIRFEMYTPADEEEDLQQYIMSR